MLKYINIDYTLLHSVLRTGVLSWRSLMRRIVFALYVMAALVADGQITLVAQTRSTSPELLRDFSATPSRIRVNQPTQILLSVRVAHPAYIPGSARVIRVHSDGRQDVLGTLHDDGKDGDIDAKDGVYSIRFDMNEPFAGSVQLRVSISVRGQIKRVVSDSVMITCLP